MKAIVFIIAVLAVYAIVKKIASKCGKIESTEIETRTFIIEQDRINRENIKTQLEIIKEQQRIAKEQERQAAQLAKHEEMLMKLDNRLADCEGQIAHNREMVDRIGKLIALEEEEQKKCAKDSPEWAKHERKIITLSNQQYTAMRKITKAQADKRVCESKLSA